MHTSERLPNDWRTISSAFRAAPPFTTFRSWILALVLLLPGPVLAAGFTCAPPATPDTPPSSRSELTELDEVIVSGSRATRRTRDLADWLKLLEGQYRYEGHVDLCGQGNAADQRPVTGKADCAGLYYDSDGSPPGSRSRLRGLYCVIDLRWPEARGEDGVPVIGGESTLSPAMVVYSLESDLPGIQFMQIDNKGMATHAKGQLTGDTLTTREPCGIPGACRKVTRITAQPGSEDISMLIDVEIDSRRVLRHALLLHRVSNIQVRAGNRRDLELVGER